MPKKFPFTFLCCFTFLPATIAQTTEPTYIRSPAFDEPEDGAYKLLLMKNGNTLLFHFRRRKGIDVIVYNKKHKVQAAVNNQVASWKQKDMQDVALQGLYEINGQAVAFMQQDRKRTPVLYRLTFDATSGKIIKEKEVATLSPRRFGTAFAMAAGALSIPRFIVRKDPDSEYYAVVLYNTMTSDRNQRIEVIHFTLITRKSIVPS